MSATEQTKRLQGAGCRVIVSLEGGKKEMLVERDDIRKLARTGTVIRVVYFFLLANLKKRGAKAIREDLAAFSGAIRKRGAVIEDVETGLLSSNPAQFRAMMALAHEHIGRHLQGAKNADLNKAKRGVPLSEFDPKSEPEYYAVYRNVVDYPTWDDMDAGFAEIDKKYGHEKPFTRYRASRKWPGGRTGRAK
jgi:hypothetical protein